jgi:hypothetical protein
MELQVADHQPTVDDQPTELTPDLRMALDLLLVLAPEVATQPTNVRPIPPLWKRQSRTADSAAPVSPVVTELFPGAGHDPALDPDFLGDPPVAETDGSCSFCGDPYGEHWDQDAEQYIDGRAWHRRDHDGQGFYADEIPAVQR